MYAVRKQTTVTSDPDKTKQKLLRELREFQGFTMVRVGHAFPFYLFKPHGESTS